MPEKFDTLILNVRLIDGTGTPAESKDVGIRAGRVAEMGDLREMNADHVVDGLGQTLAPGFIDTHTHDDLAVIAAPEMLPKLSQGVTTVVVGNCGISASPVRLRANLPDPMNLLGNYEHFRYPTFESYAAAVEAARPSINVAALVGHTAIRNNSMDRLDRAASPKEIGAMRNDLREALQGGAFGLSTGLAYLSANSAPTKEVVQLCEPLKEFGAVYATHLRSETERILSALDEAFAIGIRSQAPVIVSHLKCAGIDNSGRSSEVLQHLERARRNWKIGWDCYPYSAGSSTLDLRQVDDRVTIQITWSDPHPEVAGKTLAEIASEWRLSQLEAATELQPAGAIYHSISEDDMRQILRHPATMIGSDGLPCDPRPHPRLWGTFPRVLARYCRELDLFSLPEAIRKMTSLAAERFNLSDRGRIKPGFWADMVLFDPAKVRDLASYTDPCQKSEGIHTVWVNGTAAYKMGANTSGRSGRFLRYKPKM